MSQILTGTVDVTNNSALVTGNDTSWATVVPGHVLIVGTDNVPYWIGAVRPPEENVSGKWEIDLTAPYVGTTVANSEYAICVDFSPIYQFLMMNRGDVRTDIIFKQTILAIETILAEIDAGGVVRQKYVDILIEGDLIGATTIPVEYITPLPPGHTPKFIPKPFFEKLAPEDDNVYVSTLDSITNTGFNANLSSEAIEGHILHCAYVP